MFRGRVACDTGKGLLALHGTFVKTHLDGMHRADGDPTRGYARKHVAADLERRHGKHAGDDRPRRLAESGPTKGGPGP